MEVSSSEATAFVDLSTDNLLEEFTQDVSNTNELNKEQSKSLTITIENGMLLGLKREQQQNDTATAPRECKRLKCPECLRYTAADEEQLTRHIRKVHRGENPFQCYMCDYSTYNKSLFEEHVRIHKGIKPFKCAYCPHRNVSKKNLKRHEKIHRPDNPLKCPHCDHIARNQRSYNSHAKKDHPLKMELNLTCSWCDKKFPDENSLVMHTAQIKTCNVLLDNSDSVTDGVTDSVADRCNFVTCSIYKLKSHKEEEHGQVVEKKKRRDLFKCSLCEWSSNQKSTILLHLIHHPNQVVDEKLIDVSILRKHGIMV